MLHFFPAGMLERYTLFAFLSVLGVLQLMAAHYRWAGFSLPGRQRWQWGYTLGGGLLGVAYLWFFGRFQHLIFQPGLAGTELFTLFSVATLLAMGITFGLVSLLHQTPTAAGPTGERVDFDPGQGTLIRSANPARRPAIIAVSDLPDGEFSLSPVVNQWTEAGCAALSTDLVEDGPTEYPEVLARLPAACTYLQNQPGIDGDSVVLVGAGIGGDVVLRAAATDSTVAGVVAINPVLVPDTIGLEALRRSTFWEALRWRRLRRRLADKLAATDHVSRMDDQRVLLIYHSNSLPANRAAIDGVEVAIVQTDEEAVEQIVGWTSNLVAG